MIREARFKRKMGGKPLAADQKKSLSMLQRGASAKNDPMPSLPLMKS
jgi:hypothetical protein